MSVGIYQIKNLINHKSYIGKSKYLEDRISQFYLGDHRNSHLANSVLKYGIENFRVIILEECDEGSLNDREKYWISLLGTYNPQKGYNKTLGGDGGSPTEETRKILSKSHLGNKSWAGRTHTEDQKSKISASCKRWHREVGFSEEDKRKMSESLRGDSNGMFHKVQVHDLSTNKSLAILREDLQDFLSKNKNFVVGHTGRVWVSLVNKSGKVIDQKLTYTPDLYLTRGYIFGMKNTGRSGKVRGPYKSSTS